MFQGPEPPEAVPGGRREPQRVDLRAGGGVRGVAASLGGVLPQTAAGRQSVQDRRRRLDVSQSPELPEAVPGLTVARSAWISGPVAASGVRLPLWAVPSFRLVRAVRASGTAGKVGLCSRARELPEAVPGLTVARSVWISGPVPASVARLPLWLASSRELQRAARVSRTAGKVWP